MELINQNILLLCDKYFMANKDQKRFIDMIYGGVYGLKGKIKEVSNKFSLYIPKNIDFSNRNYTQTFIFKLPATCCTSLFNSISTLEYS